MSFFAFLCFLLSPFDCSEKHPETKLNSSSVFSVNNWFATGTKHKETVYDGVESSDICAEMVGCAKIEWPERDI